MNGAMVRAILLGAWLVGVDAWVKLVARQGACSGGEDGPWSLPVGCTDVALAGPFALSPAVRAGLPGIDLGAPLSRQLAALAVFAAVTIATILLGRGVGRAQPRQGADLLALSCLWAGAVCWGAPILVGPGVAFTELAVSGTAFGIGELAMLCGAVWLAVERVRA